MSTVRRVERGVTAALSRVEKWGTARGDRLRSWWPGLLIGLLLAQSVLQRVDGALRVSHGVGEVPGGVGDIASPTSLAEPTLAGQIVDGWGEVTALLVAYLTLDLVLMVLVALLLLVVRSRLLTRVPGDVAPEEGTKGALVLRSVGAVRISRLDRRLAVQAALRWSVLAIAAYFLSDLAETVTTVLVALCGGGGFPTWVAMTVGVLALLKWLSLLLAMAPVAMALLADQDLRRRVFAGLDALRGIVLVVLALTVLFLLLQGDIGRQIDDVVVHTSQSLPRMGLATVLAWATGALILRGGRRCVAAFADEPAGSAVTPGILRWCYLVAVVLVGTGVGLVTRESIEHLHGTVISLLLVPGAAVLIWALLSTPAAARDPVPRQRSRRAGDSTASEPGSTWVWGLAAVPPLILLLAAARAATTSWTVSGEVPWVLLLWSGALLLALVITTMAGRAGRLPQRSSGPYPWAWLATAAVLLLVAAFLPLAVWTTVGSVSTLFALAGVLTLGAVGLTLLGDAWAPRGALAVVGLRRMPLLLILGLWGVVASVADREGHYYDVPLQTSTTEPWSPVGPEQAFRDWNAESEAEAGSDPRSLVFVASSGGGIRAAYWTHLVWECGFGTRCAQPERTEHVFLASGVSGGAVGLTFALAGTLPAADQAEALGSDFLAPPLAAAVARDLPNSVLRLPWGQDRGSTLADALAAADPGLEEAFPPPAVGPHLAVSATSVEDGCRLTLSSIRQDWVRTRCEGNVTDVGTGGGPGASPVRGVQHYLCDRDGRRADLRMVDAAVLSARFPYVSPAGTLVPCRSGVNPTYALDGGMYDNSGGSSVTNVLARLSGPLDRHNAAAGARSGSCVIPRLLIVDNQFASTARAPETTRPLQSLGPVETLLSFYGDRSDRETAALAQQVQRAADRAYQLCDLAPDHPSVVVVHPVSAGGAAAPLGWTLSETTRDRMAAQVPETCRPGADPAKPVDLSPVALQATENCWAMRVVWGWLPVGDS